MASKIPQSKIASIQAPKAVAEEIEQVCIFGTLVEIHRVPRIDSDVSKLYYLANLISSMSNMDIYERKGIRIVICRKINSRNFCFRKFFLNINCHVDLCSDYINFIEERSYQDFIVISSSKKIVNDGEETCRHNRSDAADCLNPRSYIPAAFGNQYRQVESYEWRSNDVNCHTGRNPTQHENSAHSSLRNRGRLKPTSHTPGCTGRAWA